MVCVSVRCFTAAGLRVARRSDADWACSPPAALILCPTGVLGVVDIHRSVPRIHAVDGTSVGVNRKRQRGDGKTGGSLGGAGGRPTNNPPHLSCPLLADLPQMCRIREPPQEN